MTHRHAAGLVFTIADNQHVGHLLQLRVTDFQVHLLLAIIQMRTQSSRLELRVYAPRVFGVAIGDREHRERQRARSTAMMDIVMLAIAAAFFAVSIGYVYACDRM